MSEPAIRCDSCGKKFCRSEGEMSPLCGECMFGKADRPVRDRYEYEPLVCDNCERVFTRDEIQRVRKAQNFAEEVRFKCKCGHQFVLKKEQPVRDDVASDEALANSQWKFQTVLHIQRVQELLQPVVVDLVRRMDNHDATKMEDPERATFAEYTRKLKGSTYMSEEYKGFLKGMKPALDHHYATYRHHPEHFGKNGIAGMNLIDLLEMMADWKAATERHGDGNIQKSLGINRKRFNISDELTQILWNTVRDLGWHEGK